MTVAVATAGWEILRAGPLCTVQDRGRHGGLHQGIPPSGAMDPFALQVGNLLCGNPRDTAALEMAPGGLVLRALTAQIVALAGAPLEAILDGNTVPHWKSFGVQAGQTLALGAAPTGVWSYLCVAGGFDVPVVLGSRSTCLAAQFGGWHGRPLKTGDRLPVGTPAAAARTGRGLAHARQPAYRTSATIQVVAGPQADSFSAAARAAFYESAFTISTQSNRMGYRLTGPAIAPLQPDLLSEATVLGAIQVPAGGQPIVLLADRPATGGYPKIATVISVDLSGLTQLPAHATVRFQAVTLEAAQRLAAEHELLLDEIRRGCGVA